MKKIKIIILLTLFIILPIKVNALTGGIQISCDPNSILPEETSKCSITATTDESVKSVSATIELDEGLIVSNFETFEKWTNNTTENSKINISTTEDITGEFKLGDLTIKANKDSLSGNKIVKLTSIVFYDAENNSNEINDVSSNIEVKPIEVKKGLANLSVTNGTLDSLFQPYVDVSSSTSYNITINSNNFALSMEPNNINDEIIVQEAEENTTLDANNITFAPNEQGRMLINILVGSGENLVEYVLIVQKEKTEEPVTYDNSLASLTVGGKAVDLEKGKYNYEVTLKSNIGYKIQSKLSDPDNFMFDEDYNGNATITADEFIIKIIPKDSSSGYEGVEYTIVVKKETPTPSTGNTTNGSNTNNGQTSENPQTGDIPMFLMTIILSASLIISFTLYKKNIEGYN